MLAYIFTAIIAAKVTRLPWALLSALVICGLVVLVYVYLKPNAPIIAGLIVSLPLHLTVAVSFFYIGQWRRNKKARD